MRVLVLVKATEDSEAGAMPSADLIEAMGEYNEELVNAGIMLSGEGLTPSSQGKRVAFDADSRTVIDGPFSATGELVAGFWIWEVKDMDEAVEWVKRCPNPMPRTQRDRNPPHIGVRRLWRSAVRRTQGEGRQNQREPSALGRRLYEAGKKASVSDSTSAVEPQTRRRIRHIDPWLTSTLVYLTRVFA